MTKMSNPTDPADLSARITRLERELAEARAALARESAAQNGSGAGPDGTLHRRREPRMAFVLDLPLLGWREGMVSMVEYHPINVSARGMKLRVTRASLEWFAVGQTIDLCLPFCFQGNLLDGGMVRWCTAVEGGCELGVTLTHRPDVKYPITFDFTSGQPVIFGEGIAPERLHGFLYRVLEDAVAAKRAVLLYLGHLTPLLARLTRLDRSVLRFLQRTSLEVTEHKIVTNIKVLHALGARIPSLGSVSARQEFLAHFRQAILPEVDEFSLRGLDRSRDAAAYLKSIRLAERRLALHYNAGVLLAEEFANPGVSFVTPESVSVATPGTRLK